MKRSDRHLSVEGQFFSRRTTGFHREPKLFEMNFYYKETFVYISGQTRWAKSASLTLTANLPRVQLLMKILSEPP